MDTNIYNIEPYAKESIQYEIIPHNPEKEKRRMIIQR